MRLLPVILLLSLAGSALAANDFSGDPNCYGWWRFEAADFGGGGSYTPVADHSPNANDFVNFGPALPDTDAGDFAEGLCAVSFTRASASGLQIADANLSANFPFKSGDTTKKISLCFRVRLDVLATGENATFYSKYSNTGNKRCIWLHANNTSGTRVFRVWHGHTNGTTYETVTFSGGNPAVGTWYFVAWTYDDSDKSYQFEVWDLDADQRLGGGGTLQAGNTTNNISIADATLQIASRSDFGGGAGSDMHFDELIVGNRIWTPEEIDEIRQGDYPGGGAKILRLVEN